MNCAEIKAGDRVVLESSRAPRFTIATVAKVTATQIILTSNIGVGHIGRYRRMDGGPIGGGSMWPWITGLATPEQIAVFEAAEAAKAKELRKAREEREAIHAKRQQLARLFPKTFTPLVEGGDGSKYFSVGFELTAAQVRRMAALLSKGDTQ